MDDAARKCDQVVIPSRHNRRSVVRPIPGSKQKVDVIMMRLSQACPSGVQQAAGLEYYRHPCHLLSSLSFSHGAPF